MSERCASSGLIAAVILAAGSLLAGCSTEEKLTTPLATHAPWTTERTWAVVPFANESGVSTVDPLVISDRFVAELDGVEGISCLPLNRTMAALRALGLRAVMTDRDALAVMKALQVDGLVVGTITAYEPYRPLQLGIAAQAYSTDEPAERVSSADALVLPTFEASQANRERDAPTSQTSRVYDARNHDVLARLREYAKGRYAPKSGYRDQVYLASMDAFSTFVAFDVIRELMADEATRFAPATEHAVVASQP